MIAVVTSWLVLPRHATYQIAPLHLSGSVFVFAVLIGPITGLAAVGFDTVITPARAAAPSTGWRLLVATLVSFGALGAVAIAYPQLLGNGKGPTELALTGSVGLGSAAILTVLKPAATAACLRGGATGGLLTPSLATGALLGCTAGQAWQLLWPGAQIGAFAFVTAGAMLASTQRAPLCAAALMVELTHTGYALIVPLALAITGALITSRWLATRIDSHLVDQPGRSDTARWADGSEADPDQTDTSRTLGEQHPVVAAQVAERHPDQAHTPTGEEVIQQTDKESLAGIVTRLRRKHPDVDPATVRRTVAEAYEPLADSPIRDFVPVLVEQTANRALTSSRPETTLSPARGHIQPEHQRGRTSVPPKREGMTAVTSTNATQSQEAAEAHLIDRLIGRLATDWPEFGADEIARTVHKHLAAFDQSTVRDYVPVLVERASDKELRTQAHRAPTDHGPLWTRTDCRASRPQPIALSARRSDWAGRDDHRWLAPRSRVGARLV